MKHKDISDKIGNYVLTMVSELVYNKYYNFTGNFVFLYVLLYNNSFYNSKVKFASSYWFYLNFTALRQHFA